jgi:hypothetical protein
MVTNGARGQESKSRFEFVPADGRRGCQLKEAETSVGRRFLGSFANKPVLASIDIGRLVKDFPIQSLADAEGRRPDVNRPA